MSNEHHGPPFTPYCMGALGMCVGQQTTCDLSHNCTVEIIYFHYNCTQRVCDIHWYGLSCQMIIRAHHSPHIAWGLWGCAGQQPTYDLSQNCTVEMIYFHYNCTQHVYDTHWYGLSCQMIIMAHQSPHTAWGHWVCVGQQTTYDLSQNCTVEIIYFHYNCTQHVCDIHWYGLSCQMIIRATH